MGLPMQGITDKEVEDGAVVFFNILLQHTRRSHKGAVIKKFRWRVDPGTRRSTNGWRYPICNTCC
jgi:hypothetical protein